jgi:flagellar export protein FliJ
MQAFRFPLQRVLDLRNTQLEMEEVKLKQLMAAVADLDRRRMEIENAGRSAELEVREWRPVTGGDLAALGRYRMAVAQQEQNLDRQRVQAQQRVAEQHKVIQEARRRCRLLDRLKEKRLTEWETARDRELEEMAAESYLAQWNRERR